MAAELCLYVDGIGLLLSFIGAVLIFTLPDVLDYVSERADLGLRRRYFGQHYIGTGCLAAGFAPQFLAARVQAYRSLAF